MDRTKSVISFVVVFAIVFVLAGWFIHPHVPPHPDHPVGVFEAEYWVTNWSGLVLGVVLASLNAWISAKKERPRRAGTSAAGSPASHR